MAQARGLLMYRSNDAMPYGFRIVGSVHNERRLVEASAAFVGYSQCEERAEVNREAYLSAFCFGTEFQTLLTSTGSTKGYAGDCWSPWLWFDIDRDDIDAALSDCQTLVSLFIGRYELDDDGLLLFYSGSKGFHVGLPLSICGELAPSKLFNAACRRLAEALASRAGVAIDTGVYDKVRAFRAPNSRHGKTGRYKRWLDLDSLIRLPASRIVELAAVPWPFELPEAPEENAQAVVDWAEATALVNEQEQAATERRKVGTSTCNTAPGCLLNRSTTEFMRDGATTGDRHRTLFSAAANLAEFGCGFDLAWALLSEAALDSGLPPAEVRRQIQCGLNHWGSG